MRYRVVFLVSLLLLQACEITSTSASRRSEAIAKLLVEKRVDQEKLVALTNNAQCTEDSLVLDLRTKNTLKYISARISQNQDMRYKSKPRVELDKNRFVVKVEISEHSPRKKGRVAVYILNIHFETQKDDKPKIIRVESPV